MCARYTLKKSAEELAKIWNALLEEMGRFPPQFVPSVAAPVLVVQEHKRRLRAMNFGLIPAWSPEARVKFATHNARLLSTDEKTGKATRVYEKPTWREAFKEKHCIVPLSEFIEPIYSGEYAGNMVKFGRKDDGLLLAAGIWEEWVDKRSGEVRPSFSILTDDPPLFVKSVGHDRCPVFLDDEAAISWAESGGGKPQDSLQFLQARAARPDFVVSIDRPMKKGWEKRA